MTQPVVAVSAWLPEGVYQQWVEKFPSVEFRDARASADLYRALPEATITYGLPPLDRLSDAGRLRWIQLVSAGVPPQLCGPARARDIAVTNLAGLYGPSIAEHAFGLLTMLTRNLHLALRNQVEGRWDRGLAASMTELQGKTLAVVGTGNIGQALARLGRAYGMRVVGCRRTDRPAPFVDHLYLRSELHSMLAEADVLAVAAPQVAATEDMLGPAEFAALKSGALYINVSRGGVAKESALLDALRTGQVAAAGLDVYAVEPLAADHPFWTMPNVIVCPHLGGESVNNSPRPAERFARNLRNWLSGSPLEGVVDLEWGY